MSLGKSRGQSRKTSKCGIVIAGLAITTGEPQSSECETLNARDEVYSSTPQSRLPFSVLPPVSMYGDLGSLLGVTG